MAPARLLLAAAAVGAGLLLTPGAAGARGADVYVGPEQVAQSLRGTQVVVSDDSEVRSSLDLLRLRRDVNGAPHLYVAALPARALDRTPRQTAADIGRLIGDDKAVVVVVVGGQVGAAQGARSPLRAGDAAQIADSAQASSSNVQTALDTSLSRIRQDAASSSGTGSGGSPSAPRGGGSGGGLFAGFLALLVGGVGGLLFFRRRRVQRAERERLAGLRAEVDSLYARLANEVSTLNPGDDAVARQALVDAGERYTATGALLSSGRLSPDVLAQAKRTAIEGIMAGRVARQRLGLDPGPDPMPAPPANAPQVQGRQDVEVDGQTYTGYGQYQPGAGHYFGGGSYQGRYIPGGWYQRPFWQTAAISAVAFGGLGYALGGGFGGFGDEGYERGEEGYGGGFDDDRQSAGGGGDWGGGGGGGGDWGGGGGGGGGGDW